MRRISFVALCAALLVGGAASPALAVDSVSSTGPTGTATYNGDGGTDNISVSTIGANTVRFEASGDTITEGANCTQVDGDTTDCNAAAVVINGLGGDDTLDASSLTTQTVTLNGSDGEDRLTGGNAADTLNGGNDPDTLNGGGGNDDVNGDAGEDLFQLDVGNDSLDGGGGNDRFALGLAIIPTEPGSDDVVGGPGVDIVSMTAQTGSPPASADVSYTLNDQPDDGPAGRNANVHSDVEDVASAITEFQETAGFPIPIYYTGPATAEGNATLRGDDGVNSLLGGSGNDDIDGGNGNDLLGGGDGNDALRSVDGFVDRLKCGPGTDTVTADTLDVVDESCENVTRTDVGNANDVPDVPEDRAPTVAFTAPNPGAVTTGPTALTANATDDVGIATVQFIDDDRIVCNDTAVPYTCDYQPRGDDVGRNTLSVVAIDTAQQTASDRRVFTVPRFGPTRVSLRLRPARDTRMPLRFVATGRLVLPAVVTPALGCGGAFVAVQVKAGGTTISNRRVRLTQRCTYRSAVTFTSRRRFRTRRALRVFAVFAGNTVLSSRRSAVRSFRIR